jgi:hypothetical protein
MMLSIYKPRNTLRIEKRPASRIFWSLQGKHGPANTLILDFWPPGLWENKFLLFQAAKFVASSLGNEYSP